MKRTAWNMENSNSRTNRLKSTFYFKFLWIDASDESHFLSIKNFLQNVVSKSGFDRQICCILNSTEYTIMTSDCNNHICLLLMQKIRKKSFKYTTNNNNRKNWNIQHRRKSIHFFSFLLLIALRNGSLSLLNMTSTKSKNWRNATSGRDK